MTEKEILRELKLLGTTQNRKVYKRHGVDGEMYGVSYANVKKMQRKIKIDHDLAQKLWQTGNHDARVLATMIVDPAQLNKRLIDAWSKDLSNYVITDAFVTAVSQANVARASMERWIRSKDEWKGSAGWSLLSHLAMKESTMRDKYFDAYLKTIEKRIHTQKNRIRYSMNSALIAIGARSNALEQKALAVAKRIGAVEVDHGETGCKTPDAVAYIPKAREHQAKRAMPRQA